MASDVSRVFLFVFFKTIDYLLVWCGVNVLKFHLRLKFFAPKNFNQFTLRSEFVSYRRY